MAQRPHSRRNSKSRAGWGHTIRKIEKMVLDGTTCDKAQKRVYMTRDAAKEARNRLGAGLSIYACDGHFHIGHHGNWSRQEHREQHDE